MAVQREVRARVGSPRFGGRLDPSQPDVRTGLAEAEDCADVIRVQLRLGPSGEVVEACHLTYGCPPALAAADLLCEAIIGRYPEPLLPDFVDRLVRNLALAPGQRHAAEVAVAALEAALKG